MEEWISDMEEDARGQGFNRVGNLGGTNFRFFKYLV